jgi:hypothetical protein
MTLRYFPASRILCFHGWRNEGIHAPPGNRFVPSRTDGTPAESDGAPLPFPEEEVSDDPSLSCHFSIRSYASTVGSQYSDAPSTRRYNRSPKHSWKYAYSLWPWTRQMDQIDTQSRSTLSACGNTAVKHVPAA